MEPTVGRIVHYWRQRDELIVRGHPEEPLAAIVARVIRPRPRASC